MKSYSSKEVAQITGINVRTIQFWCSEEIIVPDIGTYPKRGGRGRKLLFSQSNIIECLIVQELQRRGFLLKGICTVMDWVRKYRKKSNDFCSPDELEKTKTILIINDTLEQVVLHLDMEDTLLEFSLEDFITGDTEFIIFININKFLNKVKKHFTP